MKIVINNEELEHHVVDIINEMGSNQILLDHFLGGAIEAEAMRSVTVKMFTSLE